MLLNWLSEIHEDGSLPRVMQAIWDTKKKHRRIWPTSKDSKSYQKWLKYNWKKIEEIDLYYSNVIARASKTMSECRSNLIKFKSTGTDG